MTEGSKTHFVDGQYTLFRTCIGSLAEFADAFKDAGKEYPHDTKFRIDGDCLWIKEIQDGTSERELYGELET